MSKHTPGPWKIEYCSVSGENMDGSPQDADWYTVGPAHVEHEADAKLIAAAPDLLEALEWALDCDVLPRGPRFDKAVFAIMAAKGLLEDDKE